MTLVNVHVSSCVCTRVGMSTWSHPSYLQLVRLNGHTSSCFLIRHDARDRRQPYLKKPHFAGANGHASSWASKSRAVMMACTRALTHVTLRKGRKDKASVHTLRRL
jgi:hypothetical protein